MKRRQRHWYKINVSPDKLIEKGFQVKDCGNHFKALMTPTEMVAFAYSSERADENRKPFRLDSPEYLAWKNG